MTRVFVDTNVFLRFLTNDDPAKARRVEAMFRKTVEGEMAIMTSLLVIAEIVWTLESFYKLKKHDIATKVGTILNTPNLNCPETSLIIMALDLYVHENVDFIDAYHAFLLKDSASAKIVTYDRKHFNRIPWLEVIEP